MSLLLDSGPHVTSCVPEKRPDYSERLPLNSNPPLKHPHLSTRTRQSCALSEACRRYPIASHKTKLRRINWTIPGLVSMVTFIAQPEYCIRMQAQRCHAYHFQIQGKASKNVGINTLLGPLISFSVFSSCFLYFS